MSKPQVAAGTPTFFDLYGRGQALPDEIDDYIDRWHERMDPDAKSLPLHDYLGMTLDEYEVWVHDPDVLPQILIARREARPLKDVMQDYLNELPISAGPNSSATARALRAWLAKRRSE